MPSHVMPLPLTESQIRAPLSNATKVDAFGLGLTDASVLKGCALLEVCALSDNHLDDSIFTALSSCTQLRELYLRRNCIRDIASLAQLALFPRLTHLMLSENPVASEPTYRAECLRHCPALVKLDQSDVDRARVSLQRGGPVRTQQHAAVAGLTLGVSGSSKASRYTEPRPSAPIVCALSARTENVLTAALLLINELDVQALERVISRARAALAHRTALAASPPTSAATLTPLPAPTAISTAQEKSPPSPA